EDFGRRALEIDHARVNLRKHFALGQMLRQLYVRFLKRAPEAANSIAILANIFTLGLVENVPHVRARKSAGLHQGNEILDKLLEENIVLPESVLSVDQYRLAAHAPPADLFQLRKHRLVYQRQRVP